MKYKNSFFRVNIKDDGTYLDLFPAIADGKKLDIKEVMAYLDDVNIVDYDVKSIKDALERLNDKIIQIKLCNYKVEPINERATISVSADKMVCFIRFYAPSSGGKIMNKREIMAELERERIVVGISEKIIDVFMSARQYCLSIPIAKGVKPIPSKNTEIEYFFNEKPLAKPKVLEDGSVDFHELNLFTSVKKGDILAKVTPYVNGKDGQNVYGTVIRTNKPKINGVKVGKNIATSDDRLTYTSMVDGDVCLVDGTIFVSDTLQIAADIDASTGDIEYEGSVFIPGNVRTGFCVKAKGDVQVNGVVEGATIIAGGNIVIKRGVQGMGKGVLEAGGDVCAQFFENANVKSEGNVIAGSILHSNVFAKEKIVVSGKKGFIVGGEVICDNYVEVNNIGNKMETQTMIKVGVNPDVLDELKKLVIEVNEINEKREEVSSYLNVYREKVKKGVKLSPENLKMIRQYTAELEEIDSQMGGKKERMIELKTLVDEGKKGMVRVTGTSFRGVTIFIASKIYIVKDKDKHVLYKIVDSDIEPTPF